ncbi:MAG: HAD family phosphatase [Microscillaceae bacterium]|nr:HAD family phosphatase [Microscillaceae bacterium]
MNKFAVIFDMDGVIIDSNPVHKIALQQFCHKYGFDLTEEQLRTRIYGRTNKEWITNLFGSLSPEQLQAYAFEKEELFRELYLPTIAPLAGIKNFIMALRQAQIPCAIGTSAPPANVTYVLEHTQLTGLFAVILDETYVEHGKPNPEIYLKVAQALDLPPAQCLVFEDSISGVQAAVAAGCKVAGVLTTHTPEELGKMDLAITDFTELSLDQIRALFV